MTILDYGIILLLAVWAAGAILWIKSHGSCGCGSGSCQGSCPGCGGSCGRRGDCGKR